MSTQSHRLLSILLDYKNLDAALVSAFETALSAALEGSLVYSADGERKYKCEIPITEDQDVVYRAWLQIVADVYAAQAATLGSDFCVYSSYVCYDHFCPL